MYFFFHAKHKRGLLKLHARRVIVVEIEASRGHLSLQQLKEKIKQKSPLSVALVDRDSVEWPQDGWFRIENGFDILL